MANKNITTDLNASMLSGSEEIFDCVCDPCSSDKYIEAVGFCQECSEYLCIACIGYHGKLAISKCHTVIDKSTMVNAKKPPKHQITDMLTEKCRKHPEEILKYFCKTHDQICCSVCMTLDHGSCSDKSYVPDVSGGVSKGHELKNLRADLDQLFKQIMQRQQQSKDYGITNDEYYSKAVASIAAFREQINKMHDKMEVDAKRKVITAHEENNYAIRSEKEKCHSILSELTSMTEDLEKIASIGKNNQLFVLVKLYSHRIAEMQNELMIENDKCNIKRYSFCPEENNMLSTMSDIWSLSFRKNDTPTKAKYVSKVEMKSNDDTNACHISGITFLTGERMVATDYENRAVKLFDIKSNKLMSRMYVSSKPFDITAIETNTVAVPFALENKIEIIIVSNVLIKGRTIKTTGASIAGLCYNGSHFIAACQVPASVKLIDMSGKTLKTFSIDNRGAKPRCITLSRDKSVIYLTDFQANTVSSMSPTGRVMWTYRHDKLKWPVGVAVGKDGAVYVSSRDTRTVHQLTPTGTLTRIILGCDNELEYSPKAIAYCDENDILYISSFLSEPEKNYITLYQLE